MYHQFNIQQFYVLPTQCVCVFVWIPEQTMIIPLYNINWLVFIPEMKCVYCKVQANSVTIIRVYFHLYTWRQSLWNFWCREWHWNRFFTESISFPWKSTHKCCTLISMHMLQTYIYIFIQGSIIRKRWIECCSYQAGKWTKPGNLAKSSATLEIRDNWTEIYFHCFHL